MIEKSEIIVGTLLFGFGLYSISYLLIWLFFSKLRGSLLDKFDHSACLIIAFIGSIYFIGGCSSLIFEYSTTKLQIQGFTLQDRLFGKFWVEYWMQPITFLPSVFLWFKFSRTKKWLRLIISISVMSTYESMLYIYFFAIYRDYIPARWVFNYSYYFYDWTWSLFLFGMLAVSFHLLRTSYQKFKMKDY